MNSSKYCCGLFHLRKLPNLTASDFDVVNILKDFYFFRHHYVRATN